MIEEDNFQFAEAKKVGEWLPIDFDINKLNTDKLNRKHAFYHGVNSELSSVETHANVFKEEKKPLPIFGNVGDVLPIELIEAEESKGSSFENIKNDQNW